MKISRQSLIRVVVLGVVYFVIGYGSVLLDRPGSNQIHFWRAAAWAASALVFGAHIAYEHFKLNQPPLATALHCAIAVALGGFLLAAAAITHAAMVRDHAPYLLYLIALIVWPLITGIPALLVALVAAVIARRMVR